MLLAACMIMAAAMIVWIDAPSLWRRGLKKELGVFSVLLLFATVLSITQIMHLKLPNPSDWMIRVYKPLSDVLFHSLE
ncbi:hypothetical protein PAESOLCIP111_03812 [Paenibacillus solanacearum]|uniref:Uncharacterized protein n=1 Tax=Paenibacillus solanacearum TaxID=2048548 RepID=A0A916NJM8_9BACL|nr:hypothetical protein PAESOLCIP111_03812 [Paenibacillus solanacearum]